MTDKKHITMAIESSCDETSVALVEDGRRVLSNIVSSQIDVHKEYGGVVPEIASRKHIENINKVIDKALTVGAKTLDDIDSIGVTYGPGLVGALLVGVSSAKAISYARKIPLIPVNHIEGHIYANFIGDYELEPPFTCLIVSGGHTHLVDIVDYGEYVFHGQTRDDAAGEAFDKVARTLGLGYPGGPLIDKLAKKGDPKSIDFPRSFMEEGNFDFSFSGIKSAVLNYINSEKQKKNELNIENICASFQAAVVDVLVEKTIMAARKGKKDKVVIAGGVAANDELRNRMQDRCREEGIGLKFPPKDLCTDNAAMIGSVAYYNYKRGIRADMSLNAVPNLKL